MAAATEVFAEEGYDRSSIRTVADRAGVSVAGLYYYVSSKEELLFMIQHRAFEQLIRQFQEQGQRLDDPVDLLRLLIGNHLQRFLSNLSELIVCSREMDRLVGDYRQQVEAKHRQYFGLALQLFKQLVNQGRTQVDPRMAALAMFGSINWVHTWYRPESEISAQQMADDLVEIYLRGVTPELTGTPKHGLSEERR